MKKLILLACLLCCAAGYAGRTIRFERFQEGSFVTEHTCDSVPPEAVAMWQELVGNSLKNEKIDVVIKVDRYPSENRFVFTLDARTDDASQITFLTTPK